MQETPTHTCNIDIIRTIYLQEIAITYLQIDPSVGQIMARFFVEQGTARVAGIASVLDAVHASGKGAVVSAGVRRNLPRM
jgi:hypothetical protein